MDSKSGVTSRISTSLKGVQGRSDFHMGDNLFIVIAGLDGSGKTAQARLLAEALARENRRVVSRSFPTYISQSGVAIRKWLDGEVAKPTHPTLPKLDALCLQVLMLANKAEAKAAIEREREVCDIVCDRYTQCAYAYGGADGLDDQWLIDSHDFMPKPDLSILLDVDATVAAERMSSRDKFSVYEKAPLEFRAKVAQRYRDLWKWHLGEPSWVTIDASGTVAWTQKLVQAAVTERRNQPKHSAAEEE